MRNTQILGGLAAALATAAAVHGQSTVLHVDDNAPLGGDGRSWSTAFSDLQDALAVANAAEFPPPIKIARGVYRPDRGSLDRESSFVVTSGVTLLGGFAGRGAPDPDERDPAAFVSVLSGDLRNDDTTLPDSWRENARAVIYAGAAQSAYLDGLTITGANGDSGIVMHGQAPTGEATGGSIYLTNCILHNNISNGNGGAIDGGVVSMTDCKLFQNTALGGGGAVNCPYLTMSRCEVRDNSAEFGGGLYVRGQLRIDSTLLAGNRAEYEGGAIYAFYSIPVIRFCTIAANDARDGPAIYGNLWYSLSADSQITGNIFWGNVLRTPTARVIAVTGANGLPFIANLIQGGVASLQNDGFSVAASNISLDPRFADPVGADGDPLTTGDNNYRLRFDSPCVDASELSFSNLDGSDLDGHPRTTAGGCVCRGLTDLGCYETPPGSCPTPGRRVFVRSSAAPGGDGLSWPTAFRSVQDALRAPAVTEIWVASGTYNPADGVVDRDAAFSIGCRIALRGGFVGFETHPDQRSEGSAPTVFSGDIRGDDTGDIGSTIDNSRDLVVVRGGEVVFDRITFTRSRGDQWIVGGGHAAANLRQAAVEFVDCRFTACIGQGGPVLRGVDSGITMRRCVVDHNLSTYRAAVDDYGHSHEGIISISGCDLTLLDCSIVDNLTETEVSTTGGAISAIGGSVTAEHTLFRENAVFMDRQGVYGGFCRGGAIGFVYGVSDDERLSLTNCRFINNSVVSIGEQGPPSGGALFGSGRNWTIVGCEFTGNRVSGLHGALGGAVYTNQSPATYINCTFAHNSAQGWLELGRVGGVHWAFDSAPNLTNCIFWGNTDDVSPTQTAQLGAPPGTPGRATITRSIVQGWNGSLGGQHNSGLDPLFLNPRGPDGIAGTSDDDLRLSPNSPAIDFGDSAALLAVANITTDALGLPRFFDDVGVPNAGSGPSRTLDLGAFEFQGFSCRADWDHSGIVNVGDVFAFINDFFSGGGRADFNRIDGPTLQDLFDFLTAYFTGCP